MLDSIIIQVVVVFLFLILSLSSATTTYLHFKRYQSNPPPGIGKARLQAYNDIMSQIILLNRTAVELHSDDDFIHEHEKFTLNEDSVITDCMANVKEAYHSNYHIIDKRVKDEIDEYINYLSTYQPNGAEIGKILKLSGQVVKSMRADLGLSSIFPPTEEHTSDNVNESEENDTNN